MTMSGCGVDYSKFEALTIRRAASFDLTLAPDKAFPLFTAPGEKLWIPSWEPFVLSGDGYEKGTIWVTEGHGHRSYWYVEDYNIERRHAKYVRVTPGLDSGTVEIFVRAVGETGSDVEVVYQLTGLSPAGNEKVASSLEPTAYEAMMKDWQQLIEKNRQKIEQY